MSTVQTPEAAPGAPSARSPEALAAAETLAAAPSNLAVAARRFGDDFPPLRRQWPIRLAGAVVMVLMALYIPWMFGHLSPTHAWLAWPFAAASVLSAACLALSVVNGWTSEITPPRPLEGSDVPPVAVLIPTYGEPVAMVMRTVLSVLRQDYPRSRMLVIVSDDAGNPELAAALRPLGVHYHRPPDRHAPGRDGAAKAGNLNSALALVARWLPDVRFIETRDADDEVGSERFLRQTVGLLCDDAGLAFVQTIKEAQVSAGDPFCNLDAQFYRSQMLSRNAANSVFPCGSGLVWRLEALQDIGGFPAWNLVEDLQSGFEALRRGWRSHYLPIVGAVGQHSPEDVANVVKQRGTWAIDTVRLALWRRGRGLTLRQRLQFLETPLFYVHAFTAFVYVPCTALACVSLLPLRASPLSCLWHLLPYALAAEVRLFILGQPFADRRRRQRQPLRALWRVKLIWLGMAPVYATACLKALFYGPRRKPIYRVTRKEDAHRWYWRETAPQAVLALLPLIGLGLGAMTGRLPSPLILASAGYWGILNSAALANFVARGWFGTSPLEVVRTLERRARRTARAVPALPTLDAPVDSHLIAASAEA